MKQRFGSRLDPEGDVDVSRTKRFERILICALVIALVAGVGIGGFQAAALLTPRDGVSDRGEEGAQAQAGAEAPEATPEEAPETSSTSALVVDEAGRGVDAFALWVRGRVALTGADGSALLAEADPAAGTVDVWGDVGVDGDADLTGALTVDEVYADGATIGGLEAAKAVVDSLGAQLAELDSCTSGDLMAERATLGDATAADLVAERASLAETTVTTLGVQELSAQDISVVLLHADTLIAGGIEARSLETGGVTATTCVTDDLSAAFLEALVGNFETLSAHELAFDSASGDVLDIETLEANVLEAVDLGTRSLHADVAGFTTLTVGGDTQLATLAAASITADEIEGVLGMLTVSTQSCSSVGFPAIESDGTGFIERKTIIVPAGTTAVFLSPGCGGGEWPCSWETERVSETSFDIVRRFPAAALEQMDEGTFDAIGEVSVSWLAVSIG